MILYIGNPKNYTAHTYKQTQKLLERISKLNKIAEYKINTQKSVAFIHSNNEQSKMEIWRTIPFTIASNRKKKILGNKFNQGGKRLLH